MDPLFVLLIKYHVLSLSEKGIKVQVGNDHEIAQSEKKSPSINLGVGKIN